MAKKSKAAIIRRLLLQVLSTAAVLLVMTSLVSFLFGRPAGAVGDFLARRLYWLLGGFALLLPIIAGVAVVLWLAPVRSWRRFWAFILLSAGVFLWAVLISEYARTGNPVQFRMEALASGADNFAGALGVVVARTLTGVFGVGMLMLVGLGLYWGFVLWFRRARKRDILPAIYILIYGFFLQFFVASFGAPLPVAGRCGYAVVNGLKSLFGVIGTWLVLLTGFVILVAVTVLSQPAAHNWLRTVGAGLAKFGRSLVAVFKRRPAPVIQIQTGTPAVKEPKLKPAEPVVAVEPEPAKPVIQTRPAVRTTPVRVNLDEFQEEFLKRLDQPGPADGVFKDPAEAQAEGELLMNKLREFGVDGKLTAILSGPLITRFELEPAPGVRCGGIESLADDIALALSAERVRILAPIPGKSAVGVEIPNKSRRTVYLKEVLTSTAFRQLDSPLGFALGTTITGEPYCADLRLMPHVLIAGTTGSGKSVCINSIIMSIIYRSAPDEVRFLTIDPKQLELPIYNPIPHLLSRTTIDPERVVDELSRVVDIMEARYSEFAELGVRDITSFNACCAEAGKKKKPYIVVVIDELADLMQRAPAEIEARIIRLAQMSRAVGIHLVLATQRPSVDVITGLIKANFPCRIAFQVATKVDSRTILDANGAESLLGRGDMLFLPPGKGEPVRLHGCFVSERAAKQVVELWAVRHLTGLLAELVEDPQAKAQALVEADVVEVLYDPRRARGRKLDLIREILPAEVVDNLLNRRYYEPLAEEVAGIRAEGKTETGRENDYDEYFVEAARQVVIHREASVSMLQRRLDIGWARAGRIIDQLERAGIVGPHAGSKPRKVLINDENELEQKLKELFKPEQ
uniref:FtsK domain-containing protein n=1 Tax=candidate division WOR-3 bacterium TaxID=2052148 RepID=A0A7V3PU64_UNCW3